MSKEFIAELREAAASFFKGDGGLRDTLEKAADAMESKSADQQRIETAADNCEVLRARLARYEDADGVPNGKAGGVVLPQPIKRGDEGGSGEYGAAMIRGYNACLREVARLNSSPVSAGEYGDAYQGAREDLAIWKRRALEAESKIREQDQIIDNLGNALNDENGPTFMGEPVIRAGGVDERE